jgi:hypothetical protein
MLSEIAPGPGTATASLFYARPPPRKGMLSDWIKKTAIKEEKRLLEPPFVV